MFSYLISFSGIGYWLFRVIVCVMSTNNEEFFTAPINLPLEIALLFFSLICFVMIFKRSTLGGALFFASYTIYFGTALFEAIQTFKDSGQITLSVTTYLVYALGIIIPFLNFLDCWLMKSRKLFSGSGNTDWYYKNSEYDRKMDERADRNQYRL